MAYGEVEIKTYYKTLDDIDITAGDEKELAM